MMVRDEYTDSSSAKEDETPDDISGSLLLSGLKVLFPASISVHIFCVLTSKSV